MKEWPRTWTTKFIVPLLFKNYSRFLSYSNFGFVNAYLTDKNRPYLDKHLFMVYETTSSVTKFKELDDAMRSHPNFYSHYSVKVNGKFYEVYSFLRDVGPYKEEIAELINENYHLIRYDTKIKILDFWPFGIKSPEHKYLFNLDDVITPKLELLKEIIPEEDELGDLLHKVSVAGTL